MAATRAGRRPPILSESRVPGAPRGRRTHDDRARQGTRTEPPHEGARYTADSGAGRQRRRRALRHVSGLGVARRQHLPGHRAERAAFDGGRVRRHRSRPQRCALRRRGELGGRRARRRPTARSSRRSGRGDYVVVQVSKDPVGHKGARLTTQVSLAGRYLVYVPGASSTGISRKLPDTERQRLKEILAEVVPADAGVIIRTASEGVKEEDIRSDVERLQQALDRDRCQGRRGHGQEGRRRRSRSTKSPMCWSRSSATCSTRISRADRFR